MNLNDEQFGLLTIIGLVCVTVVAVTIGVTAVSLKQLDTEFYCNQQVKE